MRDLQQYIRECVEELKTYGIFINEIPEFKVNTRAKSRFGQCKYRNGKAYEINISSFMLDESVLKDDIYLRATIIHELLHAITPGEHHTGEWKRLANKVNVRSGGKYAISRTSSYESMGIKKTSIQKIKYIVECTGCGLRWEHQRKSKSVKNPQNYVCGRCKGKLKVITL